MNIEFQKLGAEHIESVLEIERISFKSPWNRSLFEKEIQLEFSYFFVAFLEGRVVGYGGFWKAKDDADILNLAVHPAFRKKGVGRKILSYLLDSAKEIGIKRVFLEVRDTNPAAIKLYEAFGFITVGKREKYYKDDDALVLIKNLNEN